MSCYDIYWRNSCFLGTNLYIFFYFSINFIHKYILAIHYYIVMENQKNNPTVVTNDDIKKEESKKEDSPKSDK